MLVQADFEAIYESEDPWDYGSRWYEARRRQLMLAALPQARFQSALDLGCGHGVFTAALAERAEAVLGIDWSTKAIARAQQTVRQPQVSFIAGHLPLWWPDGEFDLVVVADVGYYMSPIEWQMLGDKILASLSAEGCVLLAHWRHPFEAALQPTADLHLAMIAQLGLYTHAHYQDLDLRMDVLTRSADSVAKREGFL